jgi:hypothetical protein
VKTSGAQQVAAGRCPLTGVEMPVEKTQARDNACTNGRHAANTMSGSAGMNRSGSITNSGNVRQI